MEHKIRIKNKDRSCTITYDKPDDESKIVTDKKDLAIKALVFIQFNCIATDEDKLDRLIGILENAVNEIDNINKPIGDNDGFFNNYYN